MASFAVPAMGESAGSVSFQDSFRRSPQRRGVDLSRTHRRCETRTLGQASSTLGQDGGSRWPDSSAHACTHSVIPDCALRAAVDNTAGVVCIHSNASSSSQWRALTNRLAHEYLVFTPIRSAPVRARPGRPAAQ